MFPAVNKFCLTKIKQGDIKKPETYEAIKQED